MKIFLWASDNTLIFHQLIYRKWIWPPCKGLGYMKANVGLSRQNEANLTLHKGIYKSLRILKFKQSVTNPICIIDWNWPGNWLSKSVLPTYKIAYYSKSRISDMKCGYNFKSKILLQFFSGYCYVKSDLHFLSWYLFCVISSITPICN